MHSYNCHVHSSLYKMKLKHHIEYFVYTWYCTCYIFSSFSFYCHLCMTFGFVSTVQNFTYCGVTIRILYSGGAKLLFEFIINIYIFVYLFFKRQTRFFVYCCCNHTNLKYKKRTDDQSKRKRQDHDDQ